MGVEKTGRETGKIYNTLICTNVSTLKVFLVTGGTTMNEVIASTEILVSGDSEWTLSNPLPKRLIRILEFQGPTGP